jgi:hypothetical protein
MSALQESSRELIRLIAKHNEYDAVASAISAVYEAARDNTEDDESLVSLAMTLADNVAAYHLFGKPIDDLHLSVRCYVMAEFALIQDLDSPTPA